MTSMSLVILIPASLANVSTFEKHSMETFFFLISHEKWENRRRLSTECKAHYPWCWILAWNEFLWPHYEPLKIGFSGSAEMAFNIFYWQMCSWKDFCKGKDINFMQSIWMCVLKHWGVTYFQHNWHIIKDRTEWFEEFFKKKLHMLSVKGSA